MELLDGKAVIVTGAGRGLGRAFAIGVAAEGGCVVVNDIDCDEANAVVAEIEDAGGQAIVSTSSVASWESAQAIIDDCLDAFGSLDGLVNNAVAYTFFGPPWEEDGEQIRRALEVNVMGTLYCGVHALRHMTANHNGTIVNVTSRGMAGMMGTSTYVATKGAVASATYAWAMEAMPYGVRVNALAPGALTRGHELAGRYAAHATRLAGSPDMVAPAVVYLLSDLSAGITGQVLMSAGGRITLIRHPHVLQRVEEREGWTPQGIAEVMDTVYRDELQPVGVTAGPTYEWSPDPKEAFMPSPGGPCA